MRPAWLTLLMLMLGSSGALAQAPAIATIERSGQLTWSHPATTGTFTVEWATSLTGQWHRSWSAMTNFTATGGAHRVAIPLFFRLAYTNPPPIPPSQVIEETIGAGDGVAMSFSGTLDRAPVLPGTLSIHVGAYSLTENGEGTLSGLDASGTINYQTGTWSMTLTGDPPADGESIHARYTFLTVPLGTNIVTVSDEIVGEGDGSASVFSGVLAHTPLVVGSLSIFVTGSFFDIADQSDGTLLGGFAPIFEFTGTIDYATGVWSIDLGGMALADGDPITASYSCWVP